MVARALRRPMLYLLVLVMVALGAASAIAWDRPYKPGTYEGEMKYSGGSRPVTPITLRVKKRDVLVSPTLLLNCYRPEEFGDPVETEDLPMQLGPLGPIRITGANIGQHGPRAWGFFFKEPVETAEGTLELLVEGRLKGRRAKGDIFAELQRDTDFCSDSANFRARKR
jgi:hypothetical protein